ncbi:hypothetical protein HNR43_002324 [Anoxybacillus mongoliensis]|uniref:Uncharacterized protein n=1 Tax=Anoxybacillus mongoliensis TaxID=452565 RepID=A0A7W8N8I6_9BACL|nr:hypothetical protein [Anoxybacillus mongoliensis]MBB5356340.1 hypothetical protein [Anoxybacillus mongoliensis]
MRIKRSVASTLIVLSLIVVGSVSAASYVTYATTLPMLSGDKSLASANKTNNSKSKVENSVVGQDYKANSNYSPQC